MTSQAPFGTSNAIKPEDGFNADKVRGKSVIITCGASGIGEAALRAFVKAGAFVTFGDISKERGSKIEAELGPSNVAFLLCDVTKWKDQKTLFRLAAEFSPSCSINIVFANAGVSSTDENLDEEDENGEPTEPDLIGVNVNLIAVMYTAKLAKWYFKEQNKNELRDRSLIMTASIAAYWDHSRIIQYGATKWGVRGMMRAMRQEAPSVGMRVNIIAPWFIRTHLISEDRWKALEDNIGPVYADVEDAAKAVLHLACDEKANGRSLAVVPRSHVSEGYMDLAPRDAWDVETISAENWYAKESRGIHGTGKSTLGQDEKA